MASPIVFMGHPPPLLDGVLILVLALVLALVLVLLVRWKKDAHPPAED